MTDAGLWIATSLSLLGIAAPFALYPLVLWGRACLAKNPVVPGEITPTVDLVICAHNEEKSIGAKIENALALDYPADRLTIWIASDGSTDQTVAISRSFEAENVHLLDLPRGGKVSVLNAAVAAGSAEVLAFSDANSAWEPDALRALTRPLADDRVGGVAGDQRYSQQTGPSDAHGERSYWSFDRQLKRWQTEAGNVISATGAIYSIRRSLFQPPPPDATDDFMISTGVIALGKRLVFEEGAVAIEPPAEDSGGEFRRKVRIMTRGLRGIYYRRELLRPSKTGGYAFALFLHKFWRRLTWLPYLALLMLAPACWSAGGALAGLAAAVTGLTLLGVLGLVWPKLAALRPVGLAAYVVMVNAACANAALNALRGHRVSHWDSERPAEPYAGTSS